MGGIGPDGPLRKEADFPLVEQEEKARSQAKLTGKLGCQTTGKTDGRASPTDWHQISWRKAEGKVRNLHRRIFRAVQRQDWKQVKNLSRLMLRSYSNLLVSTRRVTQVNKGKDTPGIDGEIADTPEKWSKLADALRGYQPWKAAPVKRVYIPKANGKQRPLGIPTLPKATVSDQGEAARMPSKRCSMPSITPPLAAMGGFWTPTSKVPSITSATALSRTALVRCLEENW